MSSKNFEGLQNRRRKRDVETMESPKEVFPEDGCITFWYYINSTDVQPISTSAQILVYIKYFDTNSRPELLW